MAQSLLEVEESENGFSYRIPAEESFLQELITVINLARKCCAFLDFKLILESQINTIILELSGREDIERNAQVTF